MITNKIQYDSSVVRLKCICSFTVGEHSFEQDVIYYAEVRMHSLFGRSFYMIDAEGKVKLNAADKAPYNILYFLDSHSHLEELPGHNSIDFIMTGNN